MFQSNFSNVINNKLKIFLLFLGIWLVINPIFGQKISISEEEKKLTADNKNIVNLELEIGLSKDNLVIDWKGSNIVSQVTPELGNGKKKCRKWVFPCPKTDNEEKPEKIDKRKSWKIFMAPSNIRVPLVIDSLSSEEMSNLKIIVEGPESGELKFKNLDQCCAQIKLREFPRWKRKMNRWEINLENQKDQLVNDIRIQHTVEPGPGKEGCWVYFDCDEKEK